MNQAACNLKGGKRPCCAALNCLHNMGLYSASGIWAQRPWLIRQLGADPRDSVRGAHQLELEASMAAMLFALSSSDSEASPLGLNSEPVFDPTEALLSLPLDLRALVTEANARFAESCAQYQVRPQSAANATTP